VLIAAASGRALAASARRAGYFPFVVDAFGDQDTLEAAIAHVRVDFARPIDGDKLVAALQTLACGRECVGIVCGSGFEDRVDLLTNIAGRWPLFGNSAETIARVKHPFDFAAICRAANIPHPEISMMPPGEDTGWLAKRIGGAGGWHVLSVQDADNRNADIYYQRRVDGEPVSALLLGDGRDAVVLGFSAQWTAPTAGHRFRYGGAVRPAPLANDMKEAMTAAVERFNSAMPLLGLNSADFIVDGNSFQLLEINPRPGATLPLFEPNDISLFALHLDACAGRLPVKTPSYCAAAMAGAIVYAESDISAALAIDWPEWTTDRPVAGSHIKAAQPFCSVFAYGETAYEARQLAQRRIATLRTLLAAGAP